MPEFTCKGCGACCKDASKILELLPGMRWWPGLKPDGSCDKLLLDGTCAIWETRPIACRQEALLSIYIDMLGIPAEQARALQTADCLIRRAKQRK